jgi:hypothetical protein
LELPWDIVSLGRVPVSLAYYTNEEAMAIDQHSPNNRAQAPGLGLYKVSPAK